MDTARLRRVERHVAATIRAVSGVAGAELRGHHLQVDGRPVAVASPYLTMDPDELDAPARRGVSDALALLLRHSDLGLHRELSPTEPIERFVFDVLEQLRCDSLAPLHLVGVGNNARAAFDHWCRTARANRIDENRLAMLVYTTTQMVRSRLLGAPLPEDVDDLIETTRGHLGPVIGHALRALPPTRHSQRRYAVPAAEIARLVADVAGDAPEIEVVARRYRLAVPLDWDSGDVETTATSAIGGAGDADRDDAVDLDRVGDYRVFTSQFDRVVTGDSLYRPTKTAELRTRLDAMVSAQAVSAPRLAQRLLRLLGSIERDDWRFGLDDGVLDGRRLGQLVANPTTRELFRHDRLHPRANTVVAFLIDNSGSMKRQRYEGIAVLIDTYSRALDLCGVSNEVLGFTTSAWSGGRPLAQWRAEGEPADAGRMNEALHIVYKAADTPWRRARHSIAALASTLHFREGLDGEAIAWAHGRLAARPEPRRVLVVVSDGAPTDAATANVNRPGFLDDHLAGVVDRIESWERRTGHGAIEIASIGVDREMSALFRRTVEVDLSGTLTLQHYRSLERLFA